MKAMWTIELTKLSFSLIVAYGMLAISSLFGLCLTETLDSQKWSLVNPYFEMQDGKYSSLLVPAGSELIIECDCNSNRTCVSQLRKKVYTGSVNNRQACQEDGWTTQKEQGDIVGSNYPNSTRPVFYKERVKSGVVGFECYDGNAQFRKVCVLSCDFSRISLNQTFEFKYNRTLLSLSFSLAELNNVDGCYFATINGSIDIELLTFSVELPTTFIQSGSSKNCEASKSKWYCNFTVPYNMAQAQIGSRHRILPANLTVKYNPLVTTNSVYLREVQPLVSSFSRCLNWLEGTVIFEPKKPSNLQFIHASVRCQPSDEITVSWQYDYDYISVVFGTNFSADAKINAINNGIEDDSKCGQLALSPNYQQYLTVLFELVCTCATPGHFVVTHRLATLDRNATIKVGAGRSYSCSVEAVALVSMPSANKNVTLGRAKSASEKVTLPVGPPPCNPKVPLAGYRNVFLNVTHRLVSVLLGAYQMHEYPGDVSLFTVRVYTAVIGSGWLLQNSSTVRFSDYLQSAVNITQIGPLRNELAYILLFNIANECGNNYRIEPSSLFVSAVSGLSARHKGYYEDEPNNALQWWKVRIGDRTVFRVAYNAYLDVYRRRLRAASAWDGYINHSTINSEFTLLACDSNSNHSACDFALTHESKVTVKAFWLMHNVTVGFSESYNSPRYVDLEFITSNGSDASVNEDFIRRSKVVLYRLSAYSSLNGSRPIVHYRQRPSRGVPTPELQSSDDDDDGNGTNEVDFDYEASAVSSIVMTAPTGECLYETLVSTKVVRISTYGALSSFVNEPMRSSDAANLYAQLVFKWYSCEHGKTVWFDQIMFEESAVVNSTMMKYSAVTNGIRDYVQIDHRIPAVTYRVQLPEEAARRCFCIYLTVNNRTASDCAFTCVERPRTDAPHNMQAVIGVSIVVSFALLIFVTVYCVRCRRIKRIATFVSPVKWGSHLRPSMHSDAESRSYFEAHVKFTQGTETRPLGPPVGDLVYVNVSRLPQARGTRQHAYSRRPQLQVFGQPITHSGGLAMGSAFFQNTLEPVAEDDELGCGLLDDPQNDVQTCLLQSSSGLLVPQATFERSDTQPPNAGGDHGLLSQPQSRAANTLGAADFAADESNGNVSAPDATCQNDGDDGCLLFDSAGDEAMLEQLRGIRECRM